MTASCFTLQAVSNMHHHRVAWRDAKPLNVVCKTAPGEGDPDLVAFNFGGSIIWDPVTGRSTLVAHLGVMLWRLHVILWHMGELLGHLGVECVSEWLTAPGLCQSSLCSQAEASCMLSQMSCGKQCMLVCMHAV